MMDNYILRNDPHEAKTFFIKKVLGQAEKENVGLSDTEKEMLDWEDLDPRYSNYWNIELAERFEKEVNKKNYESKISELIVHAYQDDVNRNRSAKETYRSAFLAIKKGTTYISILVEKGIAMHVARWRHFLGLTYK